MRIPLPHTFPVGVLDTHRCTHAESAITCNTRAYHWRARLMPFNHCIKFSQIDVPGIISLTQTTSISYDASIYSHRHGTCVHLYCCFLTIYTPVFPDRIWYAYSSHCSCQHVTEASLTSSSYSLINALAWCLINVVASLSQPHREVVFHLLGKKASVDTFYPFGISLALGWNVPNSIASKIPFFAAEPLYSVCPLQASFRTVSRYG